MQKMTVKSMKRLIGSILIIYTAMQSTPFYSSNLFVYVGLYILSIVLLLLCGDIIAKNSYFTAFSVFWLIYGLVSIVWAVDMYLWFRNSAILLLMTLSIIIFTNILDSKENLIYFSKVWAITIGIASLVGWYEVVFNNYHFTISDNIAKYADKNWPLFSFLNVNDFSTYLTISLPIVLLWIKNEDRKSSRRLGYVIFLSSLLLIIYVISRANLLAIAVGIAVLLMLKKAKFIIKNKYELAFIFILVLIVLVITFSIGIVDKFIESFTYEDMRSDLLRVNLIKNGLRYLKDSNYLGIGAGNLEYYLPNFQYINTYGMKYIHNWWAEVLVNFGVAVFIFYVIFWIKILLLNIRLSFSKCNNINRYISMAVVVFFIAVISPSSILLMKWLPVFTGFMVAASTMKL